MIETRVPHFKLPLQLDYRTGELMTVEQDTDDEIVQSVEVIVATPPGTRIDLPEFGTPEFVFNQAPLNVTSVVSAVGTWDNRATVDVTARVEDEVTLAIRTAVTARVG